MFKLFRCYLGFIFFFNPRGLALQLFSWCYIYSKIFVFYFLFLSAVLDKTVVKAHRLFKIVNGNPFI